MADVALRGLRKSFGALEVIHGIDLDAKDGELTVVVGPSGCGKSTLLRLIAGLEDVTDGEVLIDGVRVTDVPPAKRGVAMVFQTYALYPHMTAYDNMGFSLSLQKYGRREIDRRVRDAARILQVEHLLDRKPKELSGGQRQRVAMGRAIVRDPKVFLFDEPLSNLDAALRVQMRTEIARLKSDLAATMIYVTHDQVEAMTLADKIVVLNGGRVEQVGSPQELYQRPATKFVAGFIGSPTMNFLPARLLGADATGCRIGATGLTELALPQDASGHAQGAALTLGIRPEHLRLSEAQGSEGFEIVNVEYLGNEVYVYLEPKEGETLLIQRGEAPTTWRVGQRVTLAPDPEHVHLFDAGGRALSVKAARAVA